MDAYRHNSLTFEEFRNTAMILAKGGADLSVIESHSGSTLMNVLILGTDYKFVDEVSELIALNPLVLNFKDKEGRTPVHCLLTKNDSEVTPQHIIMLTSSTNLHEVDINGNTLLHAACQAENLAVVQHLATAGLDLSQLNNNAETLLHVAVLSQNTKLLQWLIDSKKIDINAKDSKGNTALHTATFLNKQDIVEFLVQNGADITLQNDDDKKAYDVAIKYGYYNLIPSLLTKEDLLLKIDKMESYGKELKNKGATKGQVAIDLATGLKTMAEDFFQSPFTQRNFNEFEEKFLRLLHSEDKAMSAYRVSWETIIHNIKIACTVIGLLFLAKQLIESKIKENRFLFFGQKSTTTTEDKIAAIEHIIKPSNGR